MSAGEPGEALGRRRLAAAVVRVVLEERGDLAHGEVVGTSGPFRQRFDGWEGLLGALRSWLDGMAGEDGEGPG